MRRPLKPFVTEYKQSNRRGPALNTEQASSESERSPPPRLFDLASNESEDSYEAAMRAADALFSIPGSPAQEKPAQSQPISAHRQAPNVERTPLPEATTAEKPGGRILRVLDEAPDPKLAALEAERAPKRRGRKPGSKNKPKPALPARDPQPDYTAVEAAIAAPAIPAARQVAALPSASAAAPPVQATLAAAAASHLPDGAPRTSAPRGDKKFAWVRDRLRPGEDWKRRRLPRVCW